MSDTVTGPHRARRARARLIARSALDERLRLQALAGELAEAGPGGVVRPERLVVGVARVRRDLLGDGPDLARDRLGVRGVAQQGVDPRLPCRRTAPRPRRRGAGRGAGRRGCTRTSGRRGCAAASRRCGRSPDRRARSSRRRCRSVRRRAGARSRRRRSRERLVHLLAGRRPILGAHDAAAASRRTGA